MTTLTLDQEPGIGAFVIDAEGDMWRHDEPGWTIVLLGGNPMTQRNPEVAPYDKWEFILRFGDVRLATDADFPDHAVDHALTWRPTGTPTPAMEAVRIMPFLRELTGAQARAALQMIADVMGSNDPRADPINMINLLGGLARIYRELLERDDETLKTLTEVGENPANTPKGNLR